MSPDDETPLFFLVRHRQLTMSEVGERPFPFAFRLVGGCQSSGMRRARRGGVGAQKGNEGQGGVVAVLWGRAYLDQPDRASHCPSSTPMAATTEATYDAVIIGCLLS